MSPAEQESDSLSSLEDRIQRAVQLVARLRQEREAAVEEAPVEGEIQEVAAAADESEASAEEAAAQTEGGEKDVSAEPKE